ncbi:(d)CMP kinase [Frankia nepalensis]|uniref:Cytidylate kinase n=2 Tax=Frankia nepalensis TaxID=1836974 RepID=A0A937UTC0_9ACTN|nr:(d)CMP kinase [Frankia nepalensis]MBL7497782.1 (d)CMP kinase [Frankia nepalensis]MBL7511285.1 (d)CMP kinase [Frankia nepalensis]MBL7629851.1 (d)CMP kinase [Frankia nepalensis]
MEHDHGSGAESVGRGGPGLVVAVDGPGGSGKSTVAKAVARRLGLRYLDTGAMYRAVTQLVLEQRVDLEDPQAVAELAERAVITPGTDPDAPTIAVNQVRVDAEIRTRAVTNAVSAVSAVVAVRARLVAQQRQIIAEAAQTGRGIVVEGRDIGSVVAPDAPVKVFLTASTEVRALRRSRELGEKGVDDVARTLAELDRRDVLDSTRKVDPLAVPKDAVTLDSTGMSVDEVVDVVLRHCAAAGFAPAGAAGTGGATP